MPVHVDPSLRRGLTFMTFHFPDDVATNLLTIDSTDPKSGTAEFKAAAVAIEVAERRTKDEELERRTKDEERGTQS